MQIVKKKITYVNIHRILIYIAVGLFIFASGSVYGIIYPIIFDSAFLLFAILLFVDKGCRLSGNNIVVYFIFLFLYISNILINLSYYPNVNAYISYIIRMTGAFFICNTLSLKEFRHSFINILSFLSLLGLLVYFYVYFFDGYGSFSRVGHYPMIGPFNFVKYLEYRNSNIFWEPGAYQLFLILSILDCLRSQDWKCRGQYFKQIIILSLAMLTTRSTVGYILFLMVIIFYIYTNWRVLPVRRRIAYILPVAISVILVLISFISSSTISNKFSSTNASYSIRTNDMVSSLEIIIKEFPIFGYGYESSQVNALYRMYNIRNNSVGILHEAITVGIFYVITYTALMCCNIKKRYSKDFLLAFVIIAIMWFMQDFFFYPIFYLYLFKMDYGKSKVKLK